MFQTASWIPEAEKKEIEIMKKTGEKIRPLPFGKNNDTIFVSSDKDVVIAENELFLAFDVLKVDDTMYFIGFKKRK